MTTEPVRLDPDDDALPKAVESLPSVESGHGMGPPRWLFWMLPIAAVALAVLIFWGLVETKEVPEKGEAPVVSPLVRVMTARPEPFQLTVVARGTVTPRTESDLVAEVRGRVVETSPELVEGGFFETGEMLLRLDDREHRIALDRARASVALRESEARLASADARRRRELARRGAASASDLEQFESRELVAKAALAEARAMRAQAELDLERTVVRAPFDGRVLESTVDLGQFVSPGAKLGRIFAVDYAEVRLPIQTDDLAYLDPSFEFTGIAKQIEGAPVVLSARLGGRELTWNARIERAEAMIDAQTRMLNLVARVDDPYGLEKDADVPEAPLLRETVPLSVESKVGENASGEVTVSPDRVSAEPDQEKPPRPVFSSPLPPGLFVTAEIRGRALEDVFVLPLMALRDDGQVFVRDDAGRLRVRDVHVVRRDRTHVIVDDGLETGDQIVISPLRIYSEGMDLRVVEAMPR